MKAVHVLDLLTRPLLVPCYLLAARVSVGIVNRRRARPHPRAAGDCGEAAPTLTCDPAPGPIELDDYPETSVVVPALNAETTIGRCLESIRQVDYPADHLELIVADNGSTDRTAEIAREYGAQVVVQKKRGAAAARNAGIRAARGDYVAMTDADCVVHPLWLKHFVAAIRKPSGGCSAAGGRIVNQCHDSIVSEFCEREGILGQQAAIEGRLLSFPFAITCNGFFLRGALEAVGGFDEDFEEAAAEDVDLGWRLDEAGHKIAYAPGACVFHPQRERDVDVHAQFFRYGLSEVQLYLKHRHRFSRRELSMHLWIRPLLYRHFWDAAWRWPTSARRDRRRLWRLIVLKELGHMAGKMEGGRRWKTGKYFRLWTHE